MENQITLPDLLASPDNSSPCEKEKKYSAISLIAAFTATLLIAVSLAVHIALIIAVVDICRERGTDTLITMILPSMEISNPEKQTDKKNPVQEKDLKKNDSENETKKTESKKADSEVSYINCDLSSKETGAFSLSNETSFEPDILQLSKSKKPISSKRKLYNLYGENCPLVLIYHTHGTEAFCECADKGFRSTDTSENVVAVGAELSSKLEENNIGVIHLTEMFDLEDWSSSYDRSTKAVRNILDVFPSVQYVLDIHRDSIDDGSNGYIKCSAQIESKKCAQLMFVCGTDDGGSTHMTWHDNLTVNLQLQSMLWEKSNNLMRPINLRRASFYQDTRAGAMLIEFGTCANTLDEALASADIFAECLSDYIEK